MAARVDDFPFAGSENASCTSCNRRGNFSFQILAKQFCPVVHSEAATLVNAYLPDSMDPTDRLLTAHAFRSPSRRCDFSTFFASGHQRNLNPNCVSLAGKALPMVPNAAPAPENWFGA